MTRDEPWRDDRDFARLVHQALAHLNDRAFLETHPLVVAPPVRRSGKQRQQILLNAIEELRPDPTIPESSPAWRSYHLVTLRYREELSVDCVCSRLAIGRSQFHRDLRQALEALASILRRDLSLPPHAEMSAPVQLRSVTGEPEQGAARESATALGGVPAVRGGESVLNVHLGCGSGFLDELVRLAIRALPSVVLVEYDSARVDVAVVIIPDERAESVDWVELGGPARFVIGLDPQRNLLRIRGGERGSTGEVIVEGTVAKLTEVIRDLSRSNAMPAARALRR